MRAPHDERAALLHEVVRQATCELMAPIERIEVIGDRVTCWSGRRRVSLAFNYAQGGYYDEGSNGNGPTLGEFHGTVGSGSWNVWVIKIPETRKGLFALILGKLGRTR